MTAASSHIHPQTRCNHFWSSLQDAGPSLALFLHQNSTKSDGPNFIHSSSTPPSHTLKFMIQILDFSLSDTRLMPLLNMAPTYCIRTQKQSFSLTLKLTAIKLLWVAKERTNQDSGTRKLSFIIQEFMIGIKTVKVLCMTAILWPAQTGWRWKVICLASSCCSTRTYPICCSLCPYPVGPGWSKGLSSFFLSVSRQ